VGELTGRNAKWAGVPKGKTPSRRRTENPEAHQTFHCKMEGEKEREGKRKVEMTFFKASAEGEAREVRNLRRAKVPDPN